MTVSQSAHGVDLRARRHSLARQHPALIKLGLALTIRCCNYILGQMVMSRLLITLRASF